MVHKPKAYNVMVHTPKSLQRHVTQTKGLITSWYTNQIANNVMVHKPKGLIPSWYTNKRAYNVMVHTPKAYNVMVHKPQRL